MLFLPDRTMQIFSERLSAGAHGALFSILRQCHIPIRTKNLWSCKSLLSKNKISNFLRLGVNREIFSCPRVFRRESFDFFLPCIRLQIDRFCEKFSKIFKKFWFLDYLSCHNYGIACFWQFLRSKFQICGKPVTWFKVILFPATKFDSRKSPEVLWRLYITFQFHFLRDCRLGFFPWGFIPKVAVFRVHSPRRSFILFLESEPW